MSLTHHWRMCVTGCFQWAHCAHVVMRVVRPSPHVLFVIVCGCRLTLTSVLFVIVCGYLCDRRAAAETRVEALARELEALRTTHAACTTE